MSIIRTESVSKNFGSRKALSDISIQVQEGEIYGFMGLNGAGKTTLIRTLLGMIKPDEGSIYMFNKKLDNNFKEWNNVGYLVETPYSYPELSVEENLLVYYQLRHLKNKQVIGSIIEQLKLGQYKKTKAKHLSLGNQQRLGLAKALMHKPRLLILDEPINGLDPEGIVEVRLLLKDLAAKGSTIFLSSHILGEISKLATRMAVIHSGKMIKEITSHELYSQLQSSINIKTNENPKAAQLLKDAGYTVKFTDEEIILIDAKAIDQPEKLSTLLVENGIPPKQIYLFTEDLEMYFLRTINENNE